MENLYRMLFELGDQPVLVVNASNFKIINTNPASLKLFQVDDEKLILDKNVLAFFETPITREAKIDFFKSLKETNNYRNEVLFKTVSGRILWVRLLVTLINHYGEYKYVLRIDDISELKTLTEKLKQITDIYEMVNSVTSDGIWDWNLVTGQVYFSPRWKLMIGFQPYELENELGTFWSLVHKDDFDRVRSEIQVFLSNTNSNAKYQTEFRMRHKDGHYLWILSRGGVSYDEFGNINRFTGSHIDITERKSIEQQQLEAKQRAEAAEKAKSEFLSTMSHEMRTPLNAVIGLAHLLLETGPRPNQLEHLHTLNFSAENLLSLIDTVLDFSRIESGAITIEKEPVSLTDLFKSLKAAHSIKALEKGLSLKLEINSQLPEWVLSSSLRLSQIVNNLVNNAIKFTNEGFVSIKAIWALQEQNKGVLILEVADSGIGIDDSEQAIVFERFVQAGGFATNRKYGGTGLGLAICKMLVEQMGGSIQLHSIRGKGSVFTVELPLNIIEVAENQESTLKDSDKAYNLFNPQAYSILVIEDNTINRQVLAKFLNHWGFNFSMATDGYQAIELAKEQNYDLVLTDLQMPGIDGIETRNLLRKQWNSSDTSTAFIALTAAANIETQQLLQTAGFQDYLTKPFKPEILKGLLIKYLKDKPKNIKQLIS